MSLITGSMSYNVAAVRAKFTQLLADAGDDEQPMLEIIGASFVATEPTILGMPDYEYINRETAWYDSKSRSVNDIALPIPAIWRRVADEEGLINSNYGFLVYSNENGAQFVHALAELQRDRESRRAVMIYNRPAIHEEAGKDFICTNTVQYMIRDGELHVVVQMRSNDAVFGYRNDYAWQNILQTRMWRVLKDTYQDLKLGPITWQVQSLHIYPRHAALLREAVRQNNFYLPTK